MSLTDARSAEPRLWIRSAEVGGTSIGEWELNNILRVFIFQIILMFDFFLSKLIFC